MTRQDGSCDAAFNSTADRATFRLTLWQLERRYRINRCWQLVACSVFGLLVTCRIVSCRPCCGRSVNKVGVSLGIWDCDIPGSSLPFSQRSSVIPSGCLPSSWLRPDGSLTAATCASLNARHKMSLSLLSSWCLGPLLRHARSWSPRALAALPVPHYHTHKWFTGLAFHSVCHGYSHCFVGQ